MNPINSSEQITKELYIECRPETLFSFFTDPDKLVRWMGSHVLLEPKIGGKCRIDVNDYRHWLKAKILALILGP